MGSEAGSVSRRSVGAYLECSLNLGPNFMRTNGRGIMRSATQPSSVPAHRGFSDSNICVAKSGKAAPARLRTTVDAARAEAATAR